MDLQWDRRAKNFNFVWSIPLGRTPCFLVWEKWASREIPYFFGLLKVAITRGFIGSVLADRVASNKWPEHMILKEEASSL